MIKRRKVAAVLCLCITTFFAGARCREFTTEEVEAFCSLTYSKCNEECKNPCSTLSSCGEECDQEGNYITKLDLVANDLTEIPTSIKLFTNITDL